MRAWSVTHLCPAPCDPVDCNPAGSSAYGAFQARKLEWVAISLSRDGPKSGTEPMSPASPALAGGFFFLPLGPLGKPRKAPKVPQKTKPGPSHLQKAKLLSRIWLFATPWTVTYQAPPSMGFSRQEYWSGLTFPSPGRKIFWPKIRTQVSRIIGRRFIIWATREVHLQGYHNLGKEDRGPELVTGGGKKKKEIN